MPRDPLTHSPPKKKERYPPGLSLQRGTSREESSPWSRSAVSSCALVFFHGSISDVFFFAGWAPSRAPGRPGFEAGRGRRLLEVTYKYTRGTPACETLRAPYPFSGCGKAGKSRSVRLRRPLRRTPTEQGLASLFPGAPPSFAPAFWLGGEEVLGTGFDVMTVKPIGATVKRLSLSGLPQKVFLFSRDINNDAPWVGSRLPSLMVCSRGGNLRAHHCDRLHLVISAYDPFDTRLYYTD